MESRCSFLGIMGRVQVEGEIRCDFFPKDQGFARFMGLFTSFYHFLSSPFQVFFLPNLLSFIIFYHHNFGSLYNFSKTFSSIPLEQKNILGLRMPGICSRGMLGYS